ncbi:hypothetical protein EYC80_006092 [Monilinia laxa]|uniref:Uncharacterized protein n=1 Tax=Monilinia laxa TaxID=61186 RepID=A0A5N6KHN0_MONLA|nr:hypothetical protein EYC80_006092 [Monilinia laxa]
MFNVSSVPTRETQSFYPIGNTPAANLFEYHASKSNKDMTDILLLACSDPRTRNALLFSLIIDNTASYGSQSPKEKAKAYWKSDEVAGNKDNIKALGSGGKGFLNPTFAVSVISERFILNSDPLSSYQVSQVFDNSASKTRVLEDLVASAKKDFADWCKTLAEYVAASSVVVNFYVGDAITFSHELALLGHVEVTSVLTRLYTKPWSAKPLLLDGPGASLLPTAFEIIDTSNIVE